MTSSLVRIFRRKSVHRFHLTRPRRHKRQRFSGTDLDNTETMDNGNGGNWLQLSGLNNVEVMGGHNGDNSAPLSELNNNEAFGVGNEHNPASDFRGQLLSRNYFVFHLGKGLILSYTNLNVCAVRYLCHYVSQILPTVKVWDIIKSYTTMVVVEMHDPAMDGKSFEYRLRNRLVALAQYFGFDQTRVADICQKLVVICNKRTVNVDLLDDGLEFQPLIAHLHSLKKKVIFMADLKGNIDDAMFKGHLDLLMADTINMVQIPIPCMLARAPVYIRNFSGGHVPMMEDVLKVPAMVSGSKGDQVLKMVMEDLSCKEDDTVFVSNSANHIGPLTLPELL
ncbi:d8ae8dd2-8c54-4fa4-9f6c-38a87970c203 [Sclerotinia trifoliorum]|uniref:D8ae8dd2-8c54-4fa4-9f6c-38a87970c203 n=1 Tax=Sclerotinia trifoliorum TaxID=28548 RepID=A0A8H2ZLV8_9HELO|nr:d8ae8dd2-8c54-4fa4-9f6c-38a87970c203 [Sclerotinia trifoliorum]